VTSDAAADPARATQRPPETTSSPGSKPAGTAPAAPLPRQMMANRAIAGSICPVCNRTIDLGQPVRNCEACGTPHHEACWQEHGGCGTAQCTNAPLPTLEQPQGIGVSYDVAVTAASPGTKPCPYCGEYIAEAAFKCRFCGEYLGGVGYGAGAVGYPAMTYKRTSGMAVASMVCGIVALVTCWGGLVLGPLATIFGVVASRSVDQNPAALGGKGMAIAGIVTGIIATAFWVIILLIGVGGGFR